MKKHFLVSLVIAGMVGFFNAAFGMWDDGYQPVTRTTTAIGSPNTYTAAALTKLAGSDLQCRRIKIKNMSATYTANIAFAASDTYTAQTWPLAAGAEFSEPYATSSSYGVKMDTTSTAIPAFNIKFMSVK